MNHQHNWEQIDEHDNDNRIRTVDFCECGARRYGCKAKRLDKDGNTTWGPVGEQWYNIEEA